ncbi:MAG: protein-L-isoaspartate(D-aspartate) O-methyltransferase [Candidatus Thiodiazotropha weberae]|nr:protein-L-isoaspartate(D-aspartate) O-methyltransferase [Candidatus Thiodiazotropha lotti]MCW4213009.1 protein-L-isoaspartate(D-aspartate) O-methyltransferase [Candidatus Thiodiazotropha lotti]
MLTTRQLFTALLISLVATGLTAQQTDQGYTEERQRMVQTIQREVRQTIDHLEKKQLDERVIEALKTVPRHLFVPESQRHSAYQNRPLPIGYGQTISQPYIVAIMTDLIAPQAQHKALEIGTGSGYQAAVMSPLVKQVFSMEIVEPLGQLAKARLQKLGYRNVEVAIEDGYHGWASEAPFDIIIVTAAASHIPPPLIEQLKPGGKMIIPVGSRFMTQQLLLVNKDQQNEVTVRQVLPVRFVPLINKSEL